MVASHLLILSMQREVPPLLCHKRTLRAGAESHKRAAAQTKAQSSCLSAVPHVIPRVSWAGGRPGERTGCLGKAACAARTPDGSLPLRKWGKCTWEGETCQDSWLKRDQLPVPSAPVPGTTQESPPAPSQGAPPLPGPHCHCQEQKRQRLFWKINLMLITPCLLPRVWYEHDCPHLCFAQVFLLVQWVFSSPSAQAQTVRSQMLEAWKETPISVGTGGGTPSIPPCWVTCPSCSPAWSLCVG